MRIVGYMKVPYDVTVYVHAKFSPFDASVRVIRVEAFYARDAIEQAENQRPHEGEAFLVVDVHRLTAEELK